MKRITVDISKEVYEYLQAGKKIRGSSISFEANALIELAMKERHRKKKLPLPNVTKEDNT